MNHVTSRYVTALLPVREIYNRNRIEEGEREKDREREITMMDRQSEESTPRRRWLTESNISDTDFRYRK
jgi:hypothetical protein